MRKTHKHAKFTAPSRLRLQLGPEAAYTVLPLLHLYLVCVALIGLFQCFAAGTHNSISAWKKEFRGIALFLLRFALSLSVVAS